MSLGVSIFLLVVGAILTFAVDVTTSGFSINTVGIILMIAGALGLVLFIYIVVYQQVEGSVIQPMVYSRAVQLNGLVIFIAVLVGGMLLGILGALLAIPVVEISRIVLSELVAYRRTRQEANKPAGSSLSAPPT